MSRRVLHGCVPEVECCGSVLVPLSRVRVLTRTDNGLRWRPLQGEEPR